MRIETLVNGNFVIIDTNELWAELFAEWDCKVETDVASKIASAVVNILEANEKLA